MLSLYVAQLLAVYSVFRISLSFSEFAHLFQIYHCRSVFRIVLNFLDNARRSALGSLFSFQDFAQFFGIYSFFADYSQFVGCCSDFVSY